MGLTLTLVIIVIRFPHSALKPPMRTTTSHLTSRLPLLAAFITLFLSSCKDRISLEKIKDLEAEIEQNSDALSKVKQERGRLEAKIESSTQENSALKEEKARAEAERDAKAKEIEALKKEFEAYKVRYKLGMAKRVPGMQVADFSVNGTNYRNVVLTEMTETQMNFRHLDGLGRLSLKDLPPDLRDKLGLNIVITQADPASTPTTKETALARWSNQESMVADADSAVKALKKQMDKLRSKIADTQMEINYDELQHKPTTKQKQDINDMQKELLKLQGQLGPAELLLYERRQEHSKTPIPR